MSEPFYDREAEMWVGPKTPKLEADERDAERYRAIGSHGLFWLQNREAILAAIEKAGFRLMSNQHGFWLAPVQEPK